MTNNEAIRILGLERDDWETSHCSPLVRKKAFDMAIEALKAQDATNTNVGDTIYRQAAIDKLDPLFESLAIDKIKALPSALPDVAEKLYQCKCYITDQEGLQHEVIHIGDIRRVTGWEI